MNAYPKARSSIVQIFNRAVENVINSYHKTHIINSKLPRRTVDQHYTLEGVAYESTMLMNKKSTINLS